MAKQDTDLRKYADGPALRSVIENASHEVFMLWEKKLGGGRDELEVAIMSSLGTFLDLPEVVRGMAFFRDALTGEEQRTMLVYTGYLVAQARRARAAA